MGRGVVLDNGVSNLDGLTSLSPPRLESVIQDHESRETFSSNFYWKVNPSCVSAERHQENQLSFSKSDDMAVGPITASQQGALLNDKMRFTASSSSLVGLSMPRTVEITQDELYGSRHAHDRTRAQRTTTLAARQTSDQHTSQFNEGSQGGVMQLCHSGLTALVGCRTPAVVEKSKNEEAMTFSCQQVISTSPSLLPQATTSWAPETSLRTQTTTAHQRHTVALSSRADYHKQLSFSDKNDPKASRMNEFSFQGNTRMSRRHNDSRNDCTNSLGVAQNTITAPAWRTPHASVRASDSSPTTSTEACQRPLGPSKVEFRHSRKHRETVNVSQHPLRPRITLASQRTQVISPPPEQLPVHVSSFPKTALRSSSTPPSSIQLASSHSFGANAQPHANMFAYGQPHILISVQTAGGYVCKVPAKLEHPRLQSNYQGSLRGQKRCDDSRCPPTYPQREWHRYRAPWEHHATYQRVALSSAPPPGTPQHLQYPYQHKSHTEAFSDDTDDETSSTSSFTTHARRYRPRDDATFFPDWSLRKPRRSISKRRDHTRLRCGC